MCTKSYSKCMHTFISKAIIAIRACVLVIAIAESNSKLPRAISEPALCPRIAVTQAISLPATVCARLRCRMLACV